MSKFKIRYPFVIPYWFHEFERRGGREGEGALEGLEGNVLSPRIGSFQNSATLLWRSRNSNVDPKEVIRCASLTNIHWQEGWKMIINDNPLNTASDMDRDQGQDGVQVDRGRGSTKGCKVVQVVQITFGQGTRIGCTCCIDG